jgi:ferredoxin
MASIYYFTGTGNSLAMARRLAKGLMTSPPVPMARFLDRGPFPGGKDHIALVYPVHHWGPPDLVLRFAKELKAELGTYVFAIATYGGHSGRAFQDLDKALKENAHGLTAGYHVKTVQNYVPVFPMPGEEVQRGLQEGADAKADRIIRAAKERGQGEKEHWRWRPGVRSYYLSSKRSLHTKDGLFRATDDCDGCGTCARVCPVGNIEIKEDRPIWMHRCEQCFACLHWCPRVAIEWGGATINMGRYHHPEVSLKDMEEQAGRRSTNASSE